MYPVPEPEKTPQWTTPPPPPKTTPYITDAEAIGQFRSAMEASGFIPPKKIEIGKIQRFSTKPGKPRDTGGWLIFYLDGIPAGAYGDWRGGGVHRWHATIGRELSPAEKTTVRLRLEAAEAARTAEAKQLHAKAARIANELIHAGKPATLDFGYWKKKGITDPPGNAFVVSLEAARQISGYTPSSDGEPMTGDGLLILPVSGLNDGVIYGAELVSESGKKATVKGTSKKGNCWLPCPINDPSVICVAEGGASAQTIHELTGWSVVASLANSNLPAIAKQARQAWPSAAIVVAADLSKTTGLPDEHAVKAAAAVGGKLAVPRVDVTQGHTDFNDWASLPGGREAARSALLATLQAPPERHPADEVATALRASYEMALQIADPLARCIEMVTLAKSHHLPGKPGAVADFIESAERVQRRTFPMPPADLRSYAVGLDEMESAALTPRCIVRNHTFADVAVLAGAGGTGKTTHQLYESIHIITARELYGLPVESPGPVIFVSAEDGRRVIVARLRQVIRELNPPLSRIELETVARDFIVWDASGDLAKLVDIDSNGRITPTGFADSIVTAAKSIKPSVIIFDPIISFGPGETRVNDIEQALVVEARRIVQGLDCAVRFISHVSQAAAKGGDLGQYSPRGGTALSDGCRMVSVLAIHPPGGELPPPTLNTKPESTVLKLARPKLSYCPPQPVIWLARTGYSFEWALPPPEIPPERRLAGDADQLYRFIASEAVQNRHHTKATLEQACQTLGMRRERLRQALAELEVSGRVAIAPLPQSGSKKAVIQPIRHAKPED